MDPLILTRKIRIAPTAEQGQVLCELSEKCRLLYNFALTERQQQWETNRTKPKAERTYITYTKQQNDLPTLKEQYPEYTWVYSKVLQTTLRRLDADYKSFFARWKRGDPQARPPPPLQRPTLLHDPVLQPIGVHHRHTALPHLPRVADSMKAPAFMQG